jgi:DNA-binding XRE family transcriptional regulator
MTLGEALKVYRIKNKLLQKQMAFMLGISKEYYCKIENDKVFPSKELLLKIIKMTGIEFKLNAGIKSPSSYLINQAS